MNSIFSSDATPETMRKLEQELNHLEDELRPLQSQLQEKKGVVLNLENYLSTLEKEFNSSESHVIDTEKRISELRTNRRKSINNINSLDRFQAELERRKEIAKIETNIKTKTEHVSEAQLEISNQDHSRTWEGPKR
ncbi:hypothetical protein C1645_809208 [Glomus cerebriforme]|uniref:Uncharacterized protein n=1 Tax=Glomus cerebriforme TaxID=658196 RepID=A0A397SLJ6_9GLOM|nr:hypothetical protein C1645_809208 [Glomus cerebriforme]